MKIAKRRDLKPGDVFAHGHHVYRTRTALVVIDAVSEVGFWDGSLWAVGEVAPDCLVEVIA